jgi:antibiotic biosynthesis monooxygenase (ABM) superfamily enzyme
MLVSAWLVAYPVVTASAMVLMPLMKGFSLPMHTLVMVTLMTPTVGILASILAKKLTELLALRNQQSRP